MLRRTCLTLTIVAVLLTGPHGTSRALAEPTVPGFVVTTYANVSNPEELTFDAVGNLYVGNNEVASKVTRVGPGGTPIVAYGDSPISDPDTVLFDATGTISGLAGSLLVGGNGRISAIRPDQTVVTIFGPATTFQNPSSMVFDGTGRLLFADPLRGLGTGEIFASTGAVPAPLVSVPGDPIHLAVDGADRIFVTTDSGTLAVYNPDGTVANATFASGIGSTAPLVFGSGGVFGGDLYVATDSGSLLRFDTLGNPTIVGTGFVTVEDIVFGPDGALYVSENSNGRVLRVGPGCGDGIVQPGEECDDGNATNGDCCSATCTYEVAGSACVPDSSVCTTDVCDGAGACTHLVPANPGCQASLALRGSLQIKKNVDPAKDKVGWKWKNSSSVEKEPDFGDPESGTTSLTLCVSDGNGSVLLDLTAPAGGTCPTRPCWKETRTGFKYKDAVLDPDGVLALGLKEGSNPGQAKLSVKGKGANLGTPTLPIATLPVRAWLVRSDANTCWQTTYSVAIKNDGTQFKAKSD